MIVKNTWLKTKPPQKSVINYRSILVDLAVQFKLLNPLDASEKIVPFI